VKLGVGLENLKTTKFRDGAAIPLVTDNKSWMDLITSGYCWYNNDAATYKGAYGALYNWYTVSTGKLCPTGWHMPGTSEWTTLSSYLGGDKVDGSKLKEAGTVHWTTPNLNATNETGFTALPGGCRVYVMGIFSDVKNSCLFWSSTESNSVVSNYYGLNFEGAGSYLSGTNKQFGMSVRCIKDK
jgi:uncharacterized protein (TIGR02145 family)